MDDKIKEQKPDDRGYTNADLINWLVCTELEITRTHLNKNTGIVTFFFRNTPKLSEAVEQFYSGNVLVNARKFTDAQRSVRRLIKEVKTSGGALR